MGAIKTLISSLVLAVLITLGTTVVHGTNNPLKLSMFEKNEKDTSINNHKLYVIGSLNVDEMQKTLRKYRVIVIPLTNTRNLVMDDRTVIYIDLDSLNLYGKDFLFNDNSTANFLKNAFQSHHTIILVSTKGLDGKKVVHILSEWFDIKNEIIDHSITKDNINYFLVALKLPSDSNKPMIYSLYSQDLATISPESIYAFTGSIIAGNH